MPAETDAVPPDRPHAEIAAHPEFIEIEILSEFRIVEFVFLFVRNRASNNREVGDPFTLRQFKRGCGGAVTNDIPAVITAALQQVARPAHPVCLMILIRFSCELERAAVGGS